MKRLFRKNFIILNFNPPYWEEQSHIKKRRGYWEEQSRKKKKQGKKLLGGTVPQYKRRGYWENSPSKKKERRLLGGTVLKKRERRSYWEEQSLKKKRRGYWFALIRLTVKKMAFAVGLKVITKNDRK